jgi:hypothetical protein
MTERKNGHMAHTRTPGIEQVLFELHARPDRSIVFARDPNDPDEGFDAYVSALKERIARGDVWAGCVVIVIGRFDGYSGMSSCLHGVCASSAEDFVNGHEEYERLRAEAYARLIENIAIGENTFSLPPHPAPH